MCDDYYVGACPTSYTPDREILQQHWAVEVHDAVGGILRSAVSGTEIVSSRNLKLTAIL